MDAAFNEINLFLKKHGLSINDLKVVDGFFIGPLSDQNIKAVEQNRNRGIILMDIPFVKIYELNNKKAVLAVKYFMKINGHEFDPTDSGSFSWYFGVLCYFMAFYVRRMKYLDIKSITRNWVELKEHVIVKKVKRMYADLFVYLTRKKGLSDKTAREILFNNGGFLKFEALKNILGLLNSLEAKYHPTSYEDSRSYLSKRLIDNLLYFKTHVPFNEMVGEEMEKIIRRRKIKIIKKVQKICPSNKAIIIDFDSFYTTGLLTSG